MPPTLRAIEPGLERLYCKRPVTTEKPVPSSKPDTYWVFKKRWSTMPVIKLSHIKCQMDGPVLLGSRAKICVVGP